MVEAEKITIQLTDNISQFPLMCPYQRLFAASDAEQRKIVRTQGVAVPVISAPAKTGKRGGAGGGIWDGRLCAMSAGHRH